MAANLESEKGQQAGDYNIYQYDRKLLSSRDSLQLEMSESYDVKLGPILEDADPLQRQVRLLQDAKDFLKFAPQLQGPEEKAETFRKEFTSMIKAIEDNLTEDHLQVLKSAGGMRLDDLPAYSSRKSHLNDAIHQLEDKNLIRLLRFDTTVDELQFIFASLLEMLRIVASSPAVMAAGLQAAQLATNNNNEAKDNDNQNNLAFQACLHVAAMSPDDQGKVVQLFRKLVDVVFSVVRFLLEILANLVSVTWWGTICCWTFGSGMFSSASDREKNFAELDTARKQLIGHLRDIIKEFAPPFEKNDV